MKSAIAGETRLNCNTLWGEVDMSARLHDSQRNLHVKEVSRWDPVSDSMATVAQWLCTDQRSPPLSRHRPAFTFSV